MSSQEADQNSGQKKSLKKKAQKDVFTHEEVKKLIREQTWLPLDKLPPVNLVQICAMLENSSNSGLDAIFRQIAIGNTPGPGATMKYELLRLCTFRHFPNTNQYLIRLAGAGFYYAGNGDEVVCYCCGFRREGWVESDVPKKIHMRRSPTCSFFLRNSQVNCPVPNDFDDNSNRFGFLESLNEEQHIIGQGDDAQEIPQNEGLSEVTYGPAAPKHPMYTAMSARRMSFVGWPEIRGQSSDVLAEAGFYYTGTADCVRCFCCDIDLGLRHHGVLSSSCHRTTKEEEQQQKDQQEIGACGGKPIGREASAKALAGAMAKKSVGTAEHRTKYTKSRGAIAESTQCDEEQVEENDRLRQQTLCRICANQAVCIVFLPCGHLITCDNCAPSLRKCALCGQIIKGTVKTYTKSH